MRRRSQALLCCSHFLLELLLISEYLAILYAFWIRILNILLMVFAQLSVLVFSICYFCLFMNDEVWCLVTSGFSGNFLIFFYILKSSVRLFILFFYYLPLPVVEGRSASSYPEHSWVDFPLIYLRRVLSSV